MGEIAAENDLERRLVRVILPAFHMIQTFTMGRESHFKCTEGLPEGAVLVNGILDISTLQYHLYFRHASFGIVEHGDKIPELIISFESIGGNMPLFKCHKCGTVENTALGDFWTNQDKPICSECKTGSENKCQ